jgi:hypothetical protein
VSRIGPPIVHHNELVPFQLELVAFERLGNEKTIGNMGGKKGLPESLDAPRSEIGLHGLDDLGGRDRPCMRESIEQLCEAEEVIRVSVGDIDRGQVLSTCDDPIDQRLRLLRREKSVHEDSVSLTVDERRRICDPGQ